MSLSHLIHSAAARHPELPAIMSDSSAVSYAQLAERVEAAAALLHGHQVGAGEVVALALAQSPYWQWVFLLGALRLGAVPAVLGERPLRQLAAIPGEPPRVLAPEGSPLARLPGVRGIELSLAMLRKIDDTRIVLGLPDAGAAEATAGLIEFGGLDDPRAVRLSSATLQARCLDLAGRCALDSGSRLVSALSADAAPGIEAALALWSVGGALVLPMRAGTLAGLVRATHANHLLATPRVLADWLRTDSPPALDGVCCRVSVFGAPLAPAVAAEARQWLGAAPQVLLWGAESGVFCHGTVEDLALHPDCVGRARAGLSLEVVGRDGAPLPPGQTGLLRVLTPFAATGYLDGGESLSGLGLRNGRYDTGLLGHQTADGYLHVVGAAVHRQTGDSPPNDRAGAGGRPVWSRSELEAAVGALPGVVRTCVLSLPIGRGEVPVIVYVGDNPDTTERMGQRVQAVLGGGHRFHLIRVPSMPQHPDGTVDWGGLAAALQASIRKSAGQATPSTQH